MAERHEAVSKGLQTPEIRFLLPVTGNSLLEQARKEDITNELGCYDTSGRLRKKG
jgi:hypothetical protein